jgi:hypothetical protein
MDQPLIDRFAAGADLPLKGIEGLSKSDLDAHPGPGKWSIRELVAHLFDSDLVGVDRMQRLAAMDNPLLIGYDQDRFAERLDYRTRDAGLAAEGFRTNRLVLAGVLRALPDDAFKRKGVHNERGMVSLADMVKGYADHHDHHMKFLWDKRKKLGK